jgi:hypothetical protein
LTGHHSTLLSLCNQLPNGVILWIARPGIVTSM